jgi:hypothetical protein
MEHGKEAAALANVLWQYIHDLLLIHGESRDVIDKCAFHYKEAYVLGYMHAKDEIKNNHAVTHDNTTQS